MNKEFGIKLEKRTKEFALSILRLSTQIPNSVEGKVIRNQISKSGTSVGANYREANRSRSKADFKHKIKICDSEASETAYWLELIEEMNWVDKKHLETLFKENKELLALFTSIGNTLKL